MLFINLSLLLVFSLHTLVCYLFAPCLMPASSFVPPLSAHCSLSPLASIAMVLLLACHFFLCLHSCICRLMFQALEDNSSLHIPGLAASQEVVHCGDYPNPGDGDMFVGSVIDVFGNPLAALIVDTLTSNTRTPSVREQQLYGEEGPPREYRPIEEDEQEFLQQVVAELSGVCVFAEGLRGQGHGEQG